MTDFEKQVLADLAALKTEMHLLLGNGQPGRLREVEQRVTPAHVLAEPGGLGGVGEQGEGGVLTVGGSAWRGSGDAAHGGAHAVVRP